MTKAEVMLELESYGNEQTKKTFLRHGAKEPFFGVKIGDLKKIEKKVKKDYQLALDLFDTGNSDAMYLAGLIADEKKMTKADLNHWVKKAYWHMLANYTVAWVASESPHGLELALNWIESDKELIAAAGWSTLASLATIKADADLDQKTFAKLIQRVVKEVHRAKNRVKYAMNCFLMAAGQCVNPLFDKALAAADKIGDVEVDMGDTDCQVPNAAAYLRKVKAAGRLGTKKKKARC